VLAYTVWRFASPSSGEVAIVAHYAEPRDAQFTHAYQKIVWTGLARSKADAVARYHAAAAKGV